MLKKIIRHNLVETKLNKKQTLAENKIIKKRFDFILENVKLEKRKDMNRLLNLFLVETVSLYNLGLDKKVISENLDSVLGALDKLFKGKTPAIDIFKNKGIKWIISELKIDDPSLEEFLSDYLMETQVDDIPKLLTECDFLKKKIADAIPLYFDDKMSYEISSTINGEFMNIVNTSIKEVVKNSDLSSRVESRLNNLICPTIDKLQSKFDSYLEEMRSKLVSMGDTQA